ncbi:cyclin-like protein [Zychaea mexicana]|uniref:cyclin-like protein n=1 Tax=Zychaea mexicana TaxID=64656 RepID=UPI0022FEAB3D|nr:cyclin-like protein [Zychaea mexicana]KAI9489658.1 cyclin-like protein [Zychaea mexicana]
MELHSETAVRRLRSRSVKTANEKETSTTEKNVLTEAKDAKSLAGQHLGARAALGDKSNNTKAKAARIQQQLLQQKKESHTHQQSQQQQQQQKELDDEIKEFFSDNAERYKKDDKNQPFVMPVLPIEAPQRVWKRFELTRSLSQAQLTSKRDRMAPHMSSNNPSYSMSEDDRDMYKEALAYDRELELRAEQAKLQDPTYVASRRDPMLVEEYEEEIFKHLRESELETLADPDYISNHTEISWKMRGVLIDWVIEIHYLFQLLPETLFLAVNIIDRFLSKRVVALSKLQLVGIAALFIATKFEEVSSPRLKDFIWMTDQSLKEEELMKAERFVAQVLDFKLTYANPLNFLRRASKTDDYDVHSRMLAKYFMEISCVDHRFIPIPPSKVAAASLWLSQRILTNGTWTEERARLAGYRASEIRPVVQLMLDYVSQPMIHDAFFRKWASKRLMKASVFVRTWVQQYYKNNIQVGFSHGRIDKARHLMWPLPQVRSTLTVACTGQLAIRYGCCCCSADISGMHSIIQASSVLF